MSKYVLNIMDPEDVQIQVLSQLRDSYSSLSPKERKQAYNFIIDALDNISLYTYKVASNIVYVYQDIEEHLTDEQKVESFKKILSLCKTELFKKKYAFSNAVSITLRTFLSDENFPNNELKKGYKYLLKNMTPISKGFGSRRCQLCWNKTLHEFLKAMGISSSPTTDDEIYKITNLNVFQRQLKASYNKQLNQLMNDFYKRFFKDVQEITVHDISSKDPVIKKRDKKMQKLGIDKTIMLKNGGKYTIEEKFREPNFWENRNTDILLEYISIDTKGTPGWIYTSKADYLVILYKNINIEDSQVYVFPFKTIRDWVKRYDSKFKSYKDVSAHNTNWNTISKIVPLNDVLDILSNEDKKFRKLHNLK